MQTVSRFIYGPSPEERVRKWQQQLQRESRMLDGEIRKLDAAVRKTQTQLKQLAKKGEMKNARILAREVVRTRKQKDRLYTSQAQLNSIKMQLQHQMATLKINGTLQKSTEIMKLSNSLIKLPELNKTMQAMSQEMMKVHPALCEFFRRFEREQAGIMTEMVDDTLELLDDDAEELDEEAEGEVNKVLADLLGDKLGQAGKVGSSLPAAAEPEAVEEDDAAETERMQRQLDSLLRG